MYIHVIMITEKRVYGFRGEQGEVDIRERWTEERGKGMEKCFN